MKNTLSLVALAAGISQATATGFGFHSAPKFSCPDNTDNVCIPDIVGGIDWSDLPFGGFSSYKGFEWKGFTCSEKFGKRDELTARTFQSKCITGKATSDKGSSPKISCDKNKGVNKTSIKKFQVSPEFDCDLEFHYSMPDGSTCKHRSPCKASGTVVENTQCGGATDVTIVYPQQPKKPKDTCDFGIHHIDFDCEGPKPTKPAPSTYSASIPTYATSVPASSSVATASTYSASIPAISSSSSAPANSSPASSSSAVSSTPASSSTYSASIPIGSASSSVVQSSSSPATEATSSTAAVSSSSASSLSVTSYLSTSTVFTTSVQTITSCGPTVSNCPAGSTALTTVTIPVSTTLCPVTETLSVSVPASQPTESASSPAGSASASVPVESASVSVPAGSSSQSSPVVASSATLPASSSTGTSPAGPVETLPCPGVVPSCLNTWLFSVGCKDNTDSACYCPDATFTKNIFTCLYAYGESDEVISEAISYFQGICAPFVPSNPGIATGAETITTILTATPTTIPAAVTTIEVATTVVVPCTNEAGETIPSSSSTVTVSTSLTVPGVVFSTVTSGPSSTGVAVVPGTYVATAPVAAPTVPAATATQTPAGGAAPYPTVGGSTTLITFAPSGTGVVYPTSAPASAPSAIVTAGAAHVGAGMGLLGFAGMVIAAAL
ncbi:hypothetical protein K449DRAFT_385707 [Hypoxylon sp. EC38]|nr:hypothetical protein K449DRAFT_385707 [Hypoxylon sp. EC38]